MSGSSKRRERSKGTGSPKNRRAHGALSLARGAAAGALTAIGTAFLFALIFAAALFGSSDPAHLAPIVGALSLAISSLAAGAVCARTAGAPPYMCAALGAALTAAAMLVSLIPALPKAALPVPKALYAAIPIVFAALGGRLAAPRKGRRRRRR